MSLSNLNDQPIWVGWNDENGSKVPKSVYGGNASSTNPATWGTYSQAASVVAANNYSGVGIMLTGGLVGIDLDDVIDSQGNISAWAQNIIDSIASYAEISPSGTGVHILAYGDASTLGAIGRANHTLGLEIYNHSRYFTVTGNQIGNYSLSNRTQAINNLLQRYFPGESSEDRLRNAIRNLAEDQTRRRANDAMIANASRDGTRYARIPGSGACGFCIMLGSRGFVYHTETTAGGLGNKYHRSCRCKIMAGFDDMDIEGYNPDELYDIYLEARKQTGKLVPTDAEISRQIEKIISGQGRYTSEVLNLPSVVGETFTVSKSVGARATSDYSISMPNGEETRFFPDSEIEVTVIFAGLNSQPWRELKVKNRLASFYGGNPEDWSHVAGTGWIFDPQDNGKIKKAEIHWMEHSDLGRFEFWFKNWIESDN